MMRASLKPQRGFSLVELSIVILIMGLILGGLAVPLAETISMPLVCPRTS